MKSQKKMKKLLILFALIFFAGNISAQNTHWSTLEYSYTKGPVSPEYQFSYKIIINENGEGILIYTNSSSSKDYSFSISSKKLKKINKSLKSCKVFTVNTDEMKSTDNLIGGPQRSLLITMWQAPNLDSRPQIIEIPSQLNDSYFNCIHGLYDKIENTVPDDIWEKAKQQ